AARRRAAPAGAGRRGRGLVDTNGVSGRVWARRLDGWWTVRRTVRQGRVFAQGRTSLSVGRRHEFLEGLQLLFQLAQLLVDLRALFAQPLDGVGKLGAADVEDGGHDGVGLFLRRRAWVRLLRIVHPGARARRESSTGFNATDQSGKPRSRPRCPSPIGCLSARPTWPRRACPPAPRRPPGRGFST